MQALIVKVAEFLWERDETRVKYKQGAWKAQADELTKAPYLEEATAIVEFMNALKHDTKLDVRTYVQRR